MHRFFVDKENIRDNKVAIIGEDVKHIRNVLRLKEEDIISICDKQGMDYIAEIIDLSKEKVVCDIIETKISNSEPPIEVILYQGIAKSTKMDLIIQKSTEVGVAKIVPVITDRTIVKIQDRKKEENKLERWNKITEEAAKQSKRGIIPEVCQILSFNEMLETLKNNGIIIVPYENEENIGIKEILRGAANKKINIVIGPEGGFEEEEIELLKAIGAHIVSLGPRILRTETAGLVTSAIVLYELGDLGVI
ncbi:16S rRNA (uracil(1498)-N(3))-methyltransferase [Proteiniborus sp. MB09-C3]|uniref:16S rRNA (uracil(1498)-N(3))-methyltransferase n=1 Tax=Proteiniborus sp. MB09-C3 TaxID=3050072 RepID=UPI0025548824|nr:16S rRNA (uracil(1498)-N(3))-methyltransferase [Proteiniborus sp. MB09-C3]WIV10686.1 16S rRNA (uracil(1498)-N(3))-methyltransferase [Proteiniborus sp. MB09-C3]